MLTAWTFWYVPRAARRRPAFSERSRVSPLPSARDDATPARSLLSDLTAPGLLDRSRGLRPQDFNEKNSSDAETVARPR